MTPGTFDYMEQDPATLRYSRVASDVAFPANRGDVLIQVWSDGSITCALRPGAGGIRTWGRPFDLEAS